MYTDNWIHAHRRTDALRYAYTCINSRTRTHVRIPRTQTEQERKRKGEKRFISFSVVSQTIVLYWQAAVWSSLLSSKRMFVTGSFAGLWPPGCTTPAATLLKPRLLCGQHAVIMSTVDVAGLFTTQLRVNIVYRLWSEGCKSTMHRTGKQNSTHWTICEQFLKKLYKPVPDKTELISQSGKFVSRSGKHLVWLEKNGRKPKSLLSHLKMFATQNFFPVLFSDRSTGFSFWLTK